MKYGKLEWLDIEGRNPKTEELQRRKPKKSEYELLSNPQLTQIMHILDRLQGA